MSARTAEDAYVHVVAQIDSGPSRAPGRATDSLRKAISGLRTPLARIGGDAGVRKAHLFRAARLPQVGPSEIHGAVGTGLGRYDIAIFLALDDTERIGELLDDDAFREVLDVLHTHGRGIVITPARNIGAVIPEAERGGLNLIRHLADDAADAGQAAWSDERVTRGLRLTAGELLVPIDPDSTPLRCISRAQLDPGRARDLVRALVRPAPGDERSASSRLRDPTLTAHLYWELPGPRVDRSRGNRSASYHAESHRSCDAPSLHLHRPSATTLALI